MAAEMARWRSAMSVLAGPPAAAAHPPADPWVAASPSELMREASVREGSNMLPSGAALPRIGSNILAQRQPPRAAAVPPPPGAARRLSAGQLLGRDGSDEGDRRCCLCKAAHQFMTADLPWVMQAAMRPLHDRYAGADASCRHRQDRAIGGGGGTQQAAASDNLKEAGAGRPQRVIALVAPRAKRQRTDGGGTCTDDANSHMSEYTEGSLAGACCCGRKG